MNETQQPNGESAVAGRNFTLNSRYNSEDFYRDYPDLKAGDRIAVQIGDKMYTRIAHNITFHSAEPEIMRRLSRWQQIIRALTPKRLRKSLVIRPYKPETTIIDTRPIPADTPDASIHKMTDK